MSCVKPTLLLALTISVPYPDDAKRASDGGNGTVAALAGSYIGGTVELAGRLNRIPAMERKERPIRHKNRPTRACTY